MSPLLLFILLLLLTFAVLAWALRPSKTEADIERHLSSIGTGYGSDAAHPNILKEDTLSSIPLLDRWLRQIRGITTLRLLIMQAGFSWPVGRVLFVSLAGAGLGGGLAGLYQLPLPLILLAAAAVGSAPWAYLYWKRTLRFSRFEEILPEAIDLMSRALKAGHSITSMLEMVALESSEPVASEFRRVFEEQNLGLPLREAMVNLSNRVPLQDVQFLVMAILVQKETGGNLAEILDKAAFIMRERMRLRGQLRIYTAQGRLSGWVLCMLPFVMGILLSFINPGYEKKLWTTPLGLHFLYAGFIMMAIGIFVIRRIVDIRV